MNPLPSVSPLINHPQKKTGKGSLPSGNITKNILLILQPMGPFQNLDCLCKKLLHKFQGC